MTNERTKSRYVPPAPAEPAVEHPSAVDSKAEAMKSPAFREALRKDDEREAQADFQPDSGVFGQTGAGADAPKTDPMTSQAREEKKARKENGY
ncbi:MAG: hypothetical protein EON54_28200 [Alcaligenaceae bacterium]|nr:MAG: hypothetical protein EON54_28200 [Alcaligenaceae bacterium]